MAPAFNCQLYLLHVPDTGVHTNTFFYHYCRLFRRHTAGKESEGAQETLPVIKFGCQYWHSCLFQIL